MGYILVDPQVLKNKGLNYFETLPDGRAIADFTVLKVLGDIKELEIVSSAESVLSLIKEQKASGLYDKPVEELNPDAGEVIPGNEETIPGNEGIIPEGDSSIQNEEQPAQDVTVKEETSINKEGDKV